MSQYSILEFLNNHKGKWFTSKKISNITGISASCVSRSLRKIRENYPRDIHWRNILINPNWYEYTSAKT